MRRQAAISPYQKGALSRRTTNQSRHGKAGPQNNEKRAGEKPTLKTSKLPNGHVCLVHTYQQYTYMNSKAKTTNETPTPIPASTPPLNRTQRVPFNAPTPEPRLGLTLTGGAVTGASLATKITSNPTHGYHGCYGPRLQSKVR